MVNVEYCGQTQGSIRWSAVRRLADESRRQVEGFLPNDRIERIMNVGTNREVWKYEEIVRRTVEPISIPDEIYRPSEAEQHGYGGWPYPW